MTEPIKVSGWRVGNGYENLYKKALESVLYNDSNWDQFKRNPDLCTTWGQPSKKQAEGMYKELKNDPLIFNKLPGISKMDKVGLPRLFPYDEAGYSKNLIRYADSLRLMHKYLGSLDGLKVLEFGSGYGGLAYAAHQVWKPLSWGIIDLQEAMDVAVRHCGQLGVSIVQGGSSEDADLFISEFGLTEFLGDELWNLTSKYVLPAKKVFIRCNIFPQDIRKEWITKLNGEFDLTVAREVHDEIEYNCIVIGTR